MSKIVREDIDNLHAVLTVTLSPVDYEPKVMSELNNYRKKAQMKGFRKGKTPMGMVRKLYGKSVLGEVVNEMLQKELFQYIKEEAINILGQPIPADNQEQLELEEKKDFVFRFEIGLAPEFELNGLDKNSKFEQFSVEIPADMIEKDLEAARTRTGERQSVEDAIQEQDMVKFDAVELDGDAIKENGWATSFSLVVEDRLEEAFKKELVGKTVGDQLRFNIFTIEKDRDEDFVRKYLLNVTESDMDAEIGEYFEGTITEVTRVVPAELNQEFFDKFFGEGKASTEEEAKALIEKDILKYYDRQAESLLFRDFQDRLLDLNPLEVPETFLKRWLKVSNNMTDEQVAKEYDNFVKNLQWSLIRSKMVKKFEMEVTENDVLEGFKDRIRGYFGGYGDELIVLNTANRLMQDEKQVEQLYQELMADKLFDKIKEVVTVNAKTVPMENFEAVVKQAQEELQARQNQSVLESVEESEE